MRPRPGAHPRSAPAARRRTAVLLGNLRRTAEVARPLSHRWEYVPPAEGTCMIRRPPDHRRDFFPTSGRSRDRIIPTSGTICLPSRHIESQRLGKCRGRRRRPTTPLGASAKCSRPRTSPRRKLSGHPENKNFLGAPLASSMLRTSRPNGSPVNALAAARASPRADRFLATPYAHQMGVRVTGSTPWPLVPSRPFKFCGSYRHACVAGI